MNKQKSNTKYKLIDLFAGAGGLSNGFIQTGRFEVLGAVEINKAAIKTYIKNHKNNEEIIITPENSEISDISKIDFSKFLEKKNISCDEIVVIGGPPCQGFSNANRQKNYLISGNNQLVKQYVRAIDEIKPVAFLLENVKTMDSDIHKFFVTQHIENSIFSYSSEKHLTLITKDNQKKLNNLLKEDTIILVETKFNYLKDIFEHFNKDIEILNPIIENDTFISRLRSIERKTNKLKFIKLATDEERKDVSKLIEYLEQKLAENNQIQINSIILSAIKILKKIIKQEVGQKEILNGIGPLNDLNRFLLHLKELNDEKIVFEKPLSIQVVKGKTSVIAKVKSYNIVEYLKIVFSYYGYQIDKNILDASDFGVPQRRKRFMILGVKQKKLNGKEVKLPEKISYFKKPYTTFDAISDLEKVPPQNDIKKYKPIPYFKNRILSSLQRYYQYKNDMIYNHINTKSTDLTLKRYEAIKEVNGKNFHSLADDLKYTYTNTERTQNTIYLRLNYYEPSPTVVNIRKSMWNHPNNAVALSVREAARLQSFRDEFIFHGNKDQQYQQVGNAVPPLLARGVAEKLLSIFGDKPIILIIDELFETNEDNS